MTDAFPNTGTVMVLTEEDIIIGVAAFGTGAGGKFVINNASSGDKLLINVNQIIAVKAGTGATSSTFDGSISISNIR